MKLASIKDGTRDGALVVVDRGLSRAVDASPIAPTLQAALDEWSMTEKCLRSMAAKLQETPANSFSFAPQNCMAPLPRAYQWADGSAYVRHVELVRQARGVEMPEHFWDEPLMYQGGGDSLLGPCDPILIEDEAWGIDFEAEIAVITDDVPMGTPVEEAGRHVALIMLANDVSLRNLIPDELAKGFGFFQSKPSTAFSPVAVTPDELGRAWDGGRLHLPIRTYLNGESFGSPDAGVDMTFDFRELIAHAARTRRLAAGTIVGSGTVSNTDPATGSSCIAERRAMEMIEYGEPRTPFLLFGEHVRIEMLDRSGQTIFGAIDQTVEFSAHPARREQEAAE